MNIFFYGRTRGNSGPDNVNRAWLTRLPENFLAAGSENKYLQLAEALWKLLFCRVMVVSGLSRMGCILTAAAKLLGKKAVYIMHGCAAFEAEANRIENTGAALAQERFLLETADLLLPVSRKYMLWVRQRYPQYGGKLDFLHPGMPSFPDLPRGETLPGSILACGADREIKNNLPLARAVETMEGAAYLTVCGASCHGDPFADFSHTEYLGLLPQRDYWQKLSETEVFVLNSSVESFGMSALEALACGCSLLVSRFAGVTDLLELEPEDVIWDPMDTEALKNKLSHLRKHPNNVRLRRQLAQNPWTCEDALHRLEILCRQLEQEAP